MNYCLICGEQLEQEGRDICMQCEERNTFNEHECNCNGACGNNCKCKEGNK